MLSVRSSTRCGFTLVEVIAASALLALGVVVVAAITNRSLDTLRLNTEYARAWEVMDRQLTIFEYIGIDTVVQKSITQGEFTEGDTSFKWSAVIADETYDKLKRVDMTVAWARGGRVRSISASTMFDGTGQVSEQTTLPDEGETAEDISTAADTSGGTQ
jgi:prepilin-type N-terminal cleavage/methylation domain-containing protein